MSIENVREIWMNEQASCIGSMFPSERGFVAETDEGISFYTTVGGTTVFATYNKVPSGVLTSSLKDFYCQDFQYQINDRESFVDCVCEMMENIN